MSAHGTRSCYVAGCRCEPCTVANRLYARENARRAARIRYGIEPAPVQYVDATEARDHLRWLTTQGVGTRRVCEVARVSRSEVQRIMQGVVTRCTPDFADRVLAVGANVRADGARVDSGPTRRLVAELVALGWSGRAIAQHVHGHQGAKVVPGQRATVRVDTARKVAQLHWSVTFRQQLDRKMAAEARAKHRAAERERASA